MRGREREPGVVGWTELRSGRRRQGSSETYHRHGDNPIGPRGRRRCALHADCPLPPSFNWAQGCPLAMPPGFSEIIPQFTPALFNLLFLHIEQIASSTLKMYNAPGMSCYCVILGANSDVFVTKFSSLQP